MGEDDVLKEIVKAGVKQPKAKKLLQMIKARGSPGTILERERKKLQSYSTAKQGMDELEQIVKKCQAYGIAKKIIIDLSLVRGLDYYTGPIFEISVRTKKEIGSIAGGGRYDGLVEAYGGRWTPAVGISLGIERICEIMASEGLKPVETKTKVFVAVADESLMENAMFVAQKLRAAGINTQIELMGRSLKNQLEYVDRMKIPFAVIVGEMELRKGKYTVREMAKRKQGLFTLEKIIKVLEEKK